MVMKASQPPTPAGLRTLHYATAAGWVMFKCQYKHGKGGRLQRKKEKSFLAYMQSLKKVTEEEGPPKTWGYFYEKVHSCDEFCIPKVPQLGRQPV